MDWTQGLIYLVGIVAIVLCLMGYFRKRWGLQDALEGLTEIRGLVLYATKAMADGRLTDGERDEIIERVAAVAKRFV